jgi:hypothetical protein
LWDSTVAQIGQICSKLMGLSWYETENKIKSKLDCLKLNR